MQLMRCMYRQKLDRGNGSGHAEPLIRPRGNATMSWVRPSRGALHETPPSCFACICGKCEIILKKIELWLPTNRHAASLVWTPLSPNCCPKYCNSWLFCRATRGGQRRKA